MRYRRHTLRFASPPTLLGGVLSIPVPPDTAVVFPVEAMLKISICIRFRMKSFEYGNQTDIGRRKAREEKAAERENSIHIPTAAHPDPVPTSSKQQACHPIPSEPSTHAPTSLIPQKQAHNDLISQPTNALSHPKPKRNAHIQPRNLLPRASGLTLPPPTNHNPSSKKPYIPLYQPASKAQSKPHTFSPFKTLLHPSTQHSSILPPLAPSLSLQNPSTPPDQPLQHYWYVVLTESSTLIAPPPVQSPAIEEPPDTSQGRCLMRKTRVAVSHESHDGELIASAIGSWWKAPLAYQGEKCRS